MVRITPVVLISGHSILRHYFNARFGGTQPPFHFGADSRVFNAGICSQETAGFMHKRLLESSCVSVDGGGFESKLPPGCTPVGDGGNHFAKDLSCFRRLEAV